MRVKKLVASELLKVAKLLLGYDANDVKQRLEKALYGPYDEKLLKDTIEWLQKEFFFTASRTPIGAKKIKQNANWFFLAFKNSILPLGAISNVPKEQLREEAIKRYEQFLKNDLDEFVRYFSVGESTGVTSELKVGDYLFINQIGMADATFHKYVNSISKILNDIKGWRRKAFTGTMKVVFAGAQHFHGTAAGKYKTDEDALYIRATPKVMSRTGGTYGSPEYIIVHEVGHRYERKNPTRDFNVNQWATSNYSSIRDGEVFAELFALGHFGIRTLQGKDFSATLNKFENEMGH